MTVLLFGPPGVGKSTQADLIAKKYGFVKFIMGDVLRAEVAAQTPLGKKIETYMNKGVLVPDTIIMELVEKFLDNNKHAHLLFDGFPRTLPQATGLDKSLSRIGARIDLVLEIHLDDKEIIKRLRNRGYCPKCGAIYNYRTNPPKHDQVCDLCGEHLLTRRDDSEEIIKKRLEVYERETQKLASHYNTHHVYSRVHAHGNQEEIFKKLSTIINAHSTQG